MHYAVTLPHSPKRKKRLKTKCNCKEMHMRAQFMCAYKTNFNHLSIDLSIKVFKIMMNKISLACPVPLAGFACWNLLKSSVYFCALHIRLHIIKFSCKQHFVQCLGLANTSQTIDVAHPTVS